MNTASTSDATPQAVMLSCPDGQALQGHFWRSGMPNTPQLPVLISPATGVKQHFYFRFARWLAEQGHDVLVFDYRGIGMSLQGSLAQSKATLQQWGQQDQVTAIHWLLKRTHADQLILLGHSAGGQMIGLLPNHRQVARVVGVSASSGWFGGMAPGFALKARLGLRILMPLSIRLKGYALTSAIGLGEDLPAQVARQWGQWCAAGGYATNAVKNQAAQDFHAHVRTPITVLYAADDNIATAITVQDFLRTLPHAPQQAIQVHHHNYQLPDLGHMNWFHPSHQAVWPLIYQALKGEGLPSESA